jgi:hypothetical protein
VIQSRRMRWAAYVALDRQRRNIYMKLLEGRVLKE